MKLYLAGMDRGTEGNNGGPRKHCHSKRKLDLGNNAVSNL